MGIARVSPSRAYSRLLVWVRPYGLTLFLGFLMAAVSAGAAAGYAALAGPLVAALLAPERAGTSAARLALGLLGLGIVRAVAGLGASGAMSWVGQSVVADLRGALYARLLRLPTAFYEAHASGELFARVTTDVTQVEFSVAQALSAYARDALQVLALLGVCLWLDARFLLVLLLAAPLAAWLVSRFSSAVQRVGKRVQGALADLVAAIAEPLTRLSIVHAFRARGWALARIDAAQARQLSEMRRSLFLRAAFTPTLETLGLVGAAIAIGLGAKQTALDASFAGRLLSFLSAALLLYQPLKSLAGTWSQALHGLGAAERLFELLDTPIPPDEGEPVGPLRTELSFENVSVTYPDGRVGLAGLSFRAAAGATVALVGPSGAGKSTALSLLLGFVEAGKGDVRWDGVSLRNAKRSSVRAQLAWVPQEPTLLSGTVRENLLLARGEPSLAIDDATLWDALRRAGADDFVRALPRGLDEAVGERGGLLSGGQRQRVTMARALLRAPSLLLLDEPTRSLDAESEANVQRGLAELARGRTTLVIAHRLATVQRADWIVVVENGTAVEQGTHAQLMLKDERYARLVRAGELMAQEHG